LINETRAFEIGSGGVGDGQQRCVQYVLTSGLLLQDIGLYEADVHADRAREVREDGRGRERERERERERKRENKWS
jgi:hypothetical protein